MNHYLVYQQEQTMRAVISSTDHVQPCMYLTLRCTRHSSAWYHQHKRCNVYI